MKIRALLLLYSAATIVPGSSAAVRWEVDDRTPRDTDVVSSNNASVSSSRSLLSRPTASSFSYSTSASAAPESSTRTSADLSTQRNLTTPNNTPTVLNPTHTLDNSSNAFTPSTGSSVHPGNRTTSSHLKQPHLMSLLASLHSPSPTPTPSAKPSHTRGRHKSDASTSTNTGGHGHHHHALSPVPTSSMTGPCTSLPLGAVYISFLVVHTDTVTFSGNRSHYTPPYPTPFIPNYCSPTPEPVVFSTRTDDGLIPHSFDLSSILGGLTRNPLIQLTFVTTDKNPAVVFPTENPPHWSFTDDPGPDGKSFADHQTALAPGQTATGKSNRVTKLPATMPKPTFIVTAGQSLVVINHQTFSNLRPSQTQTVTAGGQFFTIYPDAVVGQGQTVSKPVPTGTRAVALTPTNTILEGISVGVSGPSAVVDGTYFSIPTDGTFAVVGGKSVLIGPGAVVVGAHSLNFDIALPIHTSKLVAGGELVTAIGGSVVVVHSTTVTYGPGLAPTREMVGDEFVSIGPSGFTVDGSTFGGTALAPSVTSYVVVGGATVTESGASVVIIDGSTFTIGPGATLLTTTIGGQAITLGPDGVSFSTITFSYPFGPMVTSSITGTYNADQLPQETESSDEDDDSMGGRVRASHILGSLISCIAIGVLVL